MTLSISELLKDKLQKQLNALDEQLEAAEAKAKAKKASAEAEAAGAELEQELLVKINDLKERLAEGQLYLEELADAGEDRLDELKTRIAAFFD
jgi:hypothetical protein